MQTEPCVIQQQELILRTFAPGDELAFRELTEAWVTAYFELEAKDREILSDPEFHILDRGGHIVMAEFQGRTVGCCALLKLDGNIFEVSKMGVAEDCRGRGIGRKLLARVIDDARRLGASGLYLETSRKLPNAIHLYESMGFLHIPPERIHPSPYARADVYMEMALSPV